MRVAWQDHSRVTFGSANERRAEDPAVVHPVHRLRRECKVSGRWKPDRFDCAPYEVSPDISGAFGQLTFDVHVDVFQFRRILEVAGGDVGLNIVQRRNDLISFVTADQADFSQHGRVRLRTADVDFCQPRVKADALSKFFNSRVCLLLKTTAPGFGHRGFTFDKGLENAFF